MTEIKNCPFCGSDALEIWHRLNGTQSITCENCDTIGPRADLGSKAIKAWNTRADCTCRYEENQNDRSNNQ